MTTLETVTDVFCSETDCPDVKVCTQCPAMLCPVHSDEFTTCVANDEVLHHTDCQAECIECSGASAEDDIENRYERQLREGW